MITPTQTTHNPFNLMFCAQGFFALLVALLSLLHRLLGPTALRSR